MKTWKERYLDVCEKTANKEYKIYQCCNSSCHIELTQNHVRVEVPEKNEVWCVECFYKKHEIII
jgi:hypothetical protein